MLTLLRGIETVLRTALGVLLIPALILLHSLAGIALAVAGARPERIHRVYVSVSRLALWIGGTRLRVGGAGRIEPGRAYVVVPNHESGWDPLSLLAGLPRLVMRFVAKRQFMDMPVLGQALRLTGNVRVVRAQTQDDIGRIHAVMDRRDPRVSILFFAEGTRARDGALHPFKMGAFATALGYGLPVLPIGLAGTRPIWTSGILRLRRGTVAIEVGEPIPSEGLGMEDRQLLRDRTFAAVAELRSRARQRLRDAGTDPGGID
jgi:1-acyl-sn-glycerol-3-phosphate acyltransferase